MPRRRNQQTQEINIEEIFLPRIVSIHLKKRFYDLCEKADEELSCPICLDKIKCSHSCELLYCGHALHIDCYRECEKDECPICKQ